MQYQASQQLQRPRPVVSPAPRLALQPASGERGYTLFEILIALVIVALLAASVGPNFSEMVARNRKAASLNDTFAMLNATRSEAVTQQQTVSVCPSSDQATCTGNNWEDGWIIFVDDGAGAGGTAEDGNLNGTEQLVRVGQAAGGTITIRSRKFADAGAISFDLDGMASDRGTLVLCDDLGVGQASAVILNISGQPRVAVDEDGDGTLDDDEGDEVSSCP